MKAILEYIFAIRLIILNIVFLFLANSQDLYLLKKTRLGKSSVQKYFKSIDECSKLKDIIQLKTMKEELRDKNLYQLKQVGDLERQRILDLIEMDDLRNTFNENMSLNSYSKEIEMNCDNKTSRDYKIYKNDLCLFEHKMKYQRYTEQQKEYYDILLKRN